MSDEELVGQLVCVAERCFQAETGWSHYHWSQFQKESLDLLREARRQRLEGCDERLQRIQGRNEQARKRLPPTYRSDSPLARFLASSHDVSYLFSLIADLRAMLHDALQDSEAYQRGVREGTLSEREACARLIEHENEAAHSEPLGYLAVRIRARV